MRVVINCGLLIGDLGALCAMLYGGELFFRDPARSETAAICVGFGLIGWSLLTLAGRRLDSLLEKTQDIEPLLNRSLENPPQYQR